METASVQWFPGHMTKTRRMIGECLKLVDLVVELRDARIPLSSANPELPKWIGDKKRIILLNKADTADPEVTALWLSYYESQGIPAMALDSKSGKGVNRFIPLVKKELADVLEKRKQKGMVGRTLRMMVVGIPNVGKSSFINRLAGSRRTKVEDRPGVTRGKQWVTVNQGLELLDMPGVLWPKFEDPLVGEKLAFTGAVKDQVTDTEQLAARLLEWLLEGYPHLLAQRFSLSEDEIQNEPGYRLLEMVGEKRGMRMRGGEINTERAAAAVLDEYRAGKFGKISLERP